MVIEGHKLCFIGQKPPFLHIFFALKRKFNHSMLVLKGKCLNRFGIIAVEKMDK